MNLSEFREISDLSMTIFGLELWVLGGPFSSSRIEMNFYLALGHMGNYAELDLIRPEITTSKTVGANFAVFLFCTKKTQKKDVARESKFSGRGRIKKYDVIRTRFPPFA